MQRRRLAPPPVPAGPDLSSPIHPTPHFRSNLKAFAVIGQSLLLRCLLGVPGLSGQRRGPRPARCISIRQTEAKRILWRGRTEAEKHLFDARFSSPSRGARSSWCWYLFSWKTPLKSGGGNFTRCHHPEPLARPFDQRGGQTRARGSQPSCKSHPSRLVNVSDVHDKVSEAAPPGRERLG